MVLKSSLENEFDHNKILSTSSGLYLYGKEDRLTIHCFTEKLYHKTFSFFLFNKKNDLTTYGSSPFKGVYSPAYLFIYKKKDEIGDPIWDSFWRTVFRAHWLDFDNFWCSG